MSRFVPTKAIAQASSDERRPAPPRRRGVLLVSTGSPQNPDAASVRRYLAEFLSDPLVVRLPTGLRWFQGAFGRLIARFRAKRSAEMYQSIWTDRGSPLKVIMAEQVSALAAVLPDGWHVFVGMRYGRPRIADALQEIEAAGIEELVVVPMYPQFSRTTTGTVVKELYRALRQTSLHINVAMRTTWYDDVGYINAQARHIAEYAASNDLKPEDTHLLFSAHGLPVSYVKNGDPYAGYVNRTVRLVTERLGWPEDRSSLAYQSRLGPAEWLKPDIKETLAQLIQANEKKVLVCPISFPVDCLETLKEIDIRYRAVFEAHGGEFHSCPALNTYEPFISALKNLVLKGPQAATFLGEQNTPLIAPEPEEEPADGGLDSLVMIGVSLRNRVGSGRGPRLLYSEPHELCRVKKPHGGIHAFLQKVREEGGAREALVWNTCHRLEFYGWLENTDDPAGRECVIARIRHQLLGSEPEGLNVNVLFGADVWHHLMRTVSGLNSGLPGDAEVVEQLRTAHRTAEQSNMAGPRLRYLVDEAITLAHHVRAETAWGRYDPGYCYAALRRIHKAAGLQLADCRHVVVGGSTTSCSVLHTLCERFDVPRRQTTLVYRGHRGGQMKLLRNAIGSGKRLRAQSYSEGTVVAAIADADVVYFGIDRDQPVLSADDLRGARDFAERPLTIIDFNTFGSTSDVETLEGVTVWDARQLEQEVAAYAEAICAEEWFAGAVEEAEMWIEQHSPTSVTSRLRLPCAGDGEIARPQCRNCRLAAQEVAAGSNAL